jgi:opacity protein-like surface antigen
VKYSPKQQEDKMFIRNMNLWATLSFVAILFGESHVYAGEPEESRRWYAGIFGGYLSGELNSNDPSHKASTGDYNDDSPMAGILVGYQKPFDNNWVGGLELIIPLYIEKGTAVDKLYFPDLVTYEASYRYALFVSAKWGLSFGKVLPYVFGSVGFANVNGKTYNVDLEENYSPGYEQSAAATHFVWQIGGGIEYNISDVIFLSAKAGAFIAARADHTMPWNEPGPNLFGYNGLLVQANVGYRF